MHRRSHRPVGQATRGKTAQNRLRRFDQWFVVHRRAHIAEGSPGWWIDLGYGWDPGTTLEMAERFREIRPDLPILGVEIDPERVAEALPYEDRQTRFRRGGFELALQPGERARYVRAMNVLRQYEEADWAPAVAEVARGVAPGGLFIEGTCDPFGRRGVVNVLRRTPDGWASEGLLFTARLDADFEPRALQAVLPKNHIHRMVPGEPIFAFMTRWQALWEQQAPAAVFGPRFRFAETARSLCALGLVERDPRGWRRGWLVARGQWASPPPVAAGGTRG
jgi:hypothetical protein